MADEMGIDILTEEQYRGLQQLGAFDLINSNGVRIDHRTYTFAEPAFTVRTGYKFAKAQFQVVFAQEMNNVPWRYNAASFSAGISFSVEEAFKAAR